MAPRSLILLLLFQLSRFLCAAVGDALLPSGDLKLAVGHATVLPSVSLKRVIVANARLVRAQVLGPKQVLVTGLRPGSTTLILQTQGDGEKRFSVRVVPDERPGLKEHSARPRGIRVSVQFCEADSSLLQNIGVAWPSALRFHAGAEFQGPSSSGINFSAGVGGADAFLKMLSQKGMARVISRSELTVKSGEQAKFSSGGEFPVMGYKESGQQRRRVTEWKHYGTSLQVRPTTSDSLLFETEVQFELSDINAALEVGEVPSLTQNRLVTKVDSVGGETLFLSGLFQSRSSDKQSGLPLLGQIPILGGLFSETQTAEQQTQLLIALRLESTSLHSENLRQQQLQEWDAAFQEGPPVDRNASNRR